MQVRPRCPLPCTYHAHAAHMVVDGGQKQGTTLGNISSKRLMVLRILIGFQEEIQVYLCWEDTHGALATKLAVATQS